MSIKAKLEERRYLLEDAPRIIDLSGYEGIFMNKNAPYQNEIESFENMDWSRDQLEYHKLKATSHGDWGMDIAMINTKHFESREKLDEMLLADSTLTSKVPCQNIDRISFQKALDYFGVIS